MLTSRDGRVSGHSDLGPSHGYTSGEYSDGGYEYDDGYEYEDDDDDDQDDYYDGDEDDDEHGPDGGYEGDGASEDDDGHDEPLLGTAHRKQWLRISSELAASLDEFVRLEHGVRQAREPGDGGQQQQQQQQHRRQQQQQHQQQHAASKAAAPERAPMSLGRLLEDSVLPSDETDTHTDTDAPDLLRDQTRARTAAVVPSVAAASSLDARNGHDEYDDEDDDGTVGDADGAAATSAWRAHDQILDAAKAALNRQQAAEAAKAARDSDEDVRLLRRLFPALNKSAKAGATSSTMANGAVRTEQTLEDAQREIARLRDVLAGVEAKAAEQAAVNKSLQRECNDLKSKMARQDAAQREFEEYKLEQMRQIQAKHEESTRELRRERQLWERQKKAAEVLPTKKERQEIEILRGKLLEQFKTWKEKETRLVQTQDRLNRRIEELMRRNAELLDEVKALEKERAQYVARGEPRAETRPPQARSEKPRPLPAVDLVSIAPARGLSASTSRLPVPQAAAAAVAAAAPAAEPVAPATVVATGERPAAALRTRQSAPVLRDAASVASKPHDSGVSGVSAVSAPTGGAAPTKAVRARSSVSAMQQARKHEHATAELNRLASTVGLSPPFEERVSEDGRRHRTYANGTRLVWYSNGTIRQLRFDGIEVEHFANGDYRTTHPDGHMVYWFEQSRTLQTVRPDGVDILQFEDGQVETRFPDGTLEVVFQDQTVKTVFPNGDERVVFPDGRVRLTDALRICREFPYFSPNQAMDFENAFRMPDLSQLRWDQLSLNVSAQVQAHLVRVYRTLATMVGCAAVGAWLHWAHVVPGVSGGLLSGLGAILCLFAFLFTPATPDKLSSRNQLLLGFAFFDGMTLGPAVETMDMIDPTIVPVALAATALIFVCFTGAVLYSPRRQTFLVWGVLSSVLGILGWVSLINFFVGSSALYSLQLALGLISFSLFVAFDTMVIIAKAEAGSKDVQAHALELFTDLVGIFVRIMAILAKRKGDRERKREKRR
nr:Bax inhibitor 1 [Polyrhizophydium stewartii]